MMRGNHQPERARDNSRAAGKGPPPTTYTARAPWHALFRIGTRGPKLDARRIEQEGEEPLTCRPRCRYLFRFVGICSVSSDLFRFVGISRPHGHNRKETGYNKQR